MFSSAAVLDRAVPDPAEEVPVAELGRRIVAGTAEMSSFQATWLGLVAAFDRRRGWEADGVHSCAYWLGWRCGIDRRTARAHVAVARALESLPVLRTALAEGRLSYSKVRAVCRVATADNEEFLVDLALNLTATQLDRSLAGYARAHGEPLSLADDAERRSQCGATSWVDAAGLHHIEIISAPEDGALIEMALDFGRDGLYRERKAEGATAAGAAKRVEAAEGEAANAGEAAASPGGEGAQAGSKPQAGPKRCRWPGAGLGGWKRWCGSCAGGWSTPIGRAWWTRARS